FARASGVSSLGLAGALRGAGGEVATSTVKRPVSSSAFFIKGVVSCHWWLFWPSMIRTRIFLPGTASWAAVLVACVRSANPNTPITARVVHRRNIARPLVEIWSLPQSVERRLGGG